jgi:3-oxoacyl-[acyl-carrier-protein] synthase-3
MKKSIHAAITAVGMYVPEKILDNKYFESIVDTSDEWIITRTGIKERRIMETGASSDLAVKAIEDLMQTCDLKPDEIEVIIIATITPDMPFPATACLVQNKISAKNAWGFDISAACSGFLFGLQTGAKMIESGTYKKVVVVGVDKMSSMIDYTDRTTCVIFGDGASAVLLEPMKNLNYGVKDALLYIDGSGAEALNMKAGGSLHPTTHETVDKRWHYLYQDGRTVFKAAVKEMANAACDVMRKNNLSSNDVAYLVPHQANLRIIDATAERIGITKDKVMINIDKYGNTTDATIPLCLTEYYRDGKIKKGDNLILAAFGAGFSWGAIYLTWNID